MSFYNQHGKRILDIALAGAGAVLLSPVLILISAAVKLDSPGPVLFRQRRVGRNKTYFEIYKFRTMRTDTPKDVPTHLMNDSSHWITSTGRILRKTSLDELPQIFNILKGDMSIIGPRPALWNQYDLIGERDKYGANDIRPGLTGWAQINGRDELEIPVKAELDGIYTSRLRKSSASGFLMDARCFFGSFSAVLRSDGVREGAAGGSRGLHRSAGRENKEQR